MTPETSTTAIPLENAEAPIGTACWSCGEMRAAQFCHACGKVQPPQPVDYFAFFGLPRKLDLDLDRLEKDFYQLSRKLHPDLYATAGQQEQQWSLQQSSRLNDAHRTLRDPIQRTRYLLKLEGIKFDEHSGSTDEAARAKGELQEQAGAPALLEEIFELNMQLEEMQVSRKAGAPDPELTKQLEQHKSKLEQQLNELARELKGDWHEWDKLVDRELAGHSVPDAERTQVLEKMVDLLNRRNYIRNLVRTVEQVLEGIV
jgi:molecular chaperone HscB